MDNGHIFLLARIYCYLAVKPRAAVAIEDRVCALPIFAQHDGVLCRALCILNHQLLFIPGASSL